MNAKEPRWTTADRNSIDLMLEHPQFGWLPFTASLDDPENHGRDLFERAINGEFGPIADFVVDTTADS